MLGNLASPCNVLCGRKDRCNHHGLMKAPEPSCFSKDHSVCDKVKYLSTARLHNPQEKCITNHLPVTFRVMSLYYDLTPSKKAPAMPCILWVLHLSKQYYVCFALILDF